MASRVVYKLSKMHSFEALVAKHVVFSQPFHPSTRPTNSSRRSGSPRRTSQPRSKFSPTNRRPNASRRSGSPRHTLTSGRSRSPMLHRGSPPRRLLGSSPPRQGPTAPYFRGPPPPKSGPPLPFLQHPPPMLDFPMSQPQNPSHLSPIPIFVQGLNKPSGFPPPGNYCLIT